MEGKTRAFIEAYSRFYFDVNLSEEENKNYQMKKKEFGIPLDLHTTNKDAEKWIIDNCLDKGIFDKYALAWKAGKFVGVGSEKNNKYVDSFIPEDEKNYINGYGGKIDKNEFRDYCEYLNTLQYDTDLRSLYKLMQGQSPNNIGPVYNITALFFKSRGKWPIYDQFAHKAVRALSCDMIPSEVYIGTTPSKDAINSVMCMYNEYMLLLRKVFPEEINEESGKPFISRELDQALWVYGHASRRWSLEDKRVINERRTKTI